MSLVTPRVVWHRRHSSWCLSQITHIVVVHIAYLPIIPLWVGCYVQSTVINTYLFNHLFICIIFHYFLLFCIIFHYYHCLFIVKVVHIQLWHCFDTVKSHTCVVVVFLWGPQTMFGLWYCIWKIQHTKFLGGYVWHSEINIPLFSPFTHLVLLWIIHFYIFPNFLL